VPPDNLPAASAVPNYFADVLPVAIKALGLGCPVVDRLGRFIMLPDASGEDGSAGYPIVVEHEDRQRRCWVRSSTRGLHPNGAG
jgi:hypothetical protein